MHVSILSFIFVSLYACLIYVCFFFRSNHSASASDSDSASVSKNVYSENVEKSLSNLNTHLAQLNEQMAELTKLAATFNTMVGMLGEDLQGVRRVQMELVQRLRHGGRD